jgi:hypothetical protein
MRISDSPFLQEDAILGLYGVLIDQVQAERRIQPGQSQVDLQAEVFAEARVRLIDFLDDLIKLREPWESLSDWAIAALVNAAIGRIDSAEERQTVLERIKHGAKAFRELLASVGGRRRERLAKAG